MCDVQCAMCDVRRGVRLRVPYIARFARVVAAWVAFVAAPAFALTPAELVGPDLETRAVTVAGLREDRLVYFDDQRRLRNESTGQFVQLRSIGGEAAADASPGGGGFSGRLKLADGQVFVGRIETSVDAGSAEGLLHWRTPELGVVRVALEQVSRIDLADVEEPRPPAPAPAQDTVTLINGDVLAGFIAGVGTATVEIAPNQGQPLTLPLERIAALRLMNPRSYPKRADPRESILTLKAGSRLRVIDLELAAERLTFQLPLSTQPDERLGLPVEAVARIDFTGSGWRLVDLADQPMSVTAGGEVFGLPMPPRVERGVMFLHAPVGVSFELPPQAVRFAADAQLNVDETVPARAVGWADVGLIVRSDEADHRVHLGADERAAAINVPVAGSTLSIELDAGVNGPILDRVRLDHAAILLRLPVQEASDSAQ